MRARRRLTLALVAGLLAATLAPTGASADAASEVGVFTASLEEPVIYDGDVAVMTEKDCITSTDDQGNEYQNCKPAAGSLAILPDGRMLYWNALEGTENVQNGIAAEYGRVSINDQSRVLDFGGYDAPTWKRPEGDRADVGGSAAHTILPRGVADDSELGHNDNALFCTDLVHLPDGRLLVAGGTNYYSEPGNAAIPGGGPAGFVELEGQTSTRIFDAATDTWSAAGEMAYGRWYPSLVTLADGRVFVASGVTKLMKPMYPDRPEDSGRNVVQTEIYDPSTGEWTTGPASANRSLPLFPRLHLLPNGDVFYNTSGQVYNPQGQAYDQALWNLAASFDPDSQSWTDLGVPGTDDPEGALFAGFRGSTFSTMLTLEPDEDGAYRTAEFLQAGGVVGTTPGSYVAIDHSRIVSVETEGDRETVSTRTTGPLNQPRWYGTAVLLPTGEVYVANGADRDEVVGPGTGFPVTTPELFDPQTETWTPVAAQPRPRTYHNTATLLPDGRVLLAGHAPISALYGANQTLVDGTTSPNQGREPVFDVYEPPYLHRGDRPRVDSVTHDQVTHGDRVIVQLDGRPDPTAEVVLVRNTSLTHEVDGDQRAVELVVEERVGNNLVVRVPDEAAVLPNGPYMLFVVRHTDDGPVPSVSVPVEVTNGGTQVVQQGATATRTVTASPGLPTGGWRAI